MANLKLTVLSILALLLCLCNFGDCAKALSQEELKAVAKFRPMVQDILTKDYQKTDKYLVRWLRARDMDIPAAVEMLKTALKWRKDNRIDAILKETILTFPNPPYIIDGVDKQGSPIVTMYPARVDTRRQIIAGNEAKLVRYFDQFLETISVKLREMDGNSTSDIVQNINIYDFTNYNLKQHGCVGCFPIYVEWVKHYEDYYPDLCKLLVFVNLPRIAVPLVEVLRPAMSPPTQKVFKVFGPDRQEWAPFLLKFINPNELTYQFGGNKKLN
jgi:hypothetical protein